MLVTRLTHVFCDGIPKHLLRWASNSDNPRSKNDLQSFAILLRMFLPSTDRYDIINFFLFYLSSVISFLLCLLCAFLLSLSASAASSCIFSFSDIYLLLSSPSFVLLLLSSLFFYSSNIFALLLWYLLICFSCSFYKFLLSLPILFPLSSFKLNFLSPFLHSKTYSVVSSSFRS